jgi:putative protease
MAKPKITTKLELLAPAKNLRSGKLAIDAGADAVYIAGPKFGARQAAGNPIADICELIAYAHQFRAKVYLALNTILRDAELPEAKKLIEQAYTAGIDGAIIQDLGLLELNLPPIKLIASTQTDNYDTDRIKFLEKSGFKRIILAREMSLGQISKLRRQTKAELEVFVHGALCVSFSGRCYLSQALAGRSANRGECLQACRLPYSLLDASGKAIVKDKYLLSLKDLNLSNSLEDLIDAGVTSFKIEGRLKDEDYVANITYHYRRLLDGIIAKRRNLSKSSVGEVEAGFESDTACTFNRSFTDYFINGRQPDIISPRTPKSLGKLLGRVTRLHDDGSFELDKEVVIRPGDGLCFFDASEQLSGSQACRVVDKRIYLDSLKGLQTGALVYRNFDSAFVRSLVDNPPLRRLPISWNLSDSSAGLRLIAEDEEGNQGIYELSTELALAKDALQAEHNWSEQLSKLGNTVFISASCNFSWKKPLFCPISTINEARRQAIASLLVSRQAAYKREIVKRTLVRHRYPSKSIGYEANVYNSAAKEFYRQAGVESVEPAFESLRRPAGQRVMTCKHCLKHYMGWCPKSQEKPISGLPRPVEPLYLQNSHGQKLKLSFDCRNCQMELWY